MRIIYMGGGLEPLKELFARKFNIISVVSQPSRPKGRGKKQVDPVTVAYAKEVGLTTWQPERISSADALEYLASLKPDLVVTCSYGQILSKSFLSIPRLGTVNIHPSLLPLYRGATPVPAALLNGDAQTGVSLMYTVRKMDAGPVIAQKKVTIFPRETADQLLQRLFVLGGEMLIDVITDLSQGGEIHSSPQNDELASSCRKILKEDGLVSWGGGSVEIVRRFRAFFPWPGSYTYWGGKRLVLLDVDLDSMTNLAPGKFTFDAEQNVLRVGCAEGHVLIRRLCLEGKAPVDARSFWNGSQGKSKEFI